MMTHPRLAKEGHLYIALSLVVALAVSYLAGWLWSLPFWLLALFVLQFFRDPSRADHVAAVLASLAKAEGAECAKATLLSPADGRVVFVGREQDPYLKREAIKISVFMNVFSVHANRAPLTGEVKERWYTRGKFLNAALDKSSLQNERNALWLRADGAGESAAGDINMSAGKAGTDNRGQNTEHGTQGVAHDKPKSGHRDVVCVQIAGLIARRIHCYCNRGDHLQVGQRYGFIRFGSRVDIYLDAHAQVKTALGRKVYAGCDILAQLPANKTTP